MSLLIKALDKAQNAKIEQVQAQSAKIEQAKIAEVSASKLKATIKSETDAINKSQNKTLQSASKAASHGVELSLSPTDSGFSEPVAPLISASHTAVTAADESTTASRQQYPRQQSTSQISSNQHVAARTSAANVFTAKGVEAKNDSTRLLLIAGAGLIALLGMGLYFYQFVDNSPPIVVPPRPLNQLVVAPPSSSEAAQLQLSNQQPLESGAPEAMSADIAEPLASAFVPVEQMLVAEQRANPINKRTKAAAMVKEDEFSADENVSEDMPQQKLEDLVVTTESVKPIKTSSKTSGRSKNNVIIASDSASIQVTKSSQQAGVSPTLMAAYEAYNIGNDKDAIKLYKQVLQRDVRNVDALLGLGAIASRQGRSADANGWYSKVLEVDPRNNIAKTAVLDSQSQGNELSNETSLKNMLAKQPDDANLHVALGNLYAEQNQWPSAQQAYFDAYSLNKTADNAYNLAVSLDQMGKPKLALPYYQRALEQVNTSSNIDKSALEARIAAIR